MSASPGPTPAFLPKSFVALRGYSRHQFLADLQAGLVVGVVAIPLALAFAIASGVSPEKGLVTAVVAGFLISLLGGSRVQIGGPTGAFVVIVYGIVQKYGVDGLAVCTFLAGILLVAMGLARLGGAIKFIPYPVVTGFTSGIAVIIFSSEVKDLLGLRMGTVPSPFLEKWSAFGKAFASFSPAAVGVSAGSLAILIFWPRSLEKDSGSDRRDSGRDGGRRRIQDSGRDDRFPVRRVPRVDSLAPPAGRQPRANPRARCLPPSRSRSSPAIESLLSAVVADGMIGSRHKSNLELVAQGIANIASPVFGGIPATGAIARTATNVKNGGRTPVAGMIHSRSRLLFMLLLLGRWAALIPLATLAAVLVVVAYHMSEWRSFATLTQGAPERRDGSRDHVPSDRPRRSHRGRPGRGSSWPRSSS